MLSKLPYPTLNQFISSLQNHEQMIATAKEEEKIEPHRNQAFLSQRAHGRNERGDIKILRWMFFYFQVGYQKHQSIAIIHGSDLSGTLRCLQKIEEEIDKEAKTYCFYYVKEVVRAFFI